VYSDYTTWKKELQECAGEDYPNILDCTLTTKELDAVFDSGFGNLSGKSFTAWSEKYVYFPAEYDGSEWVERVARNPCKEPTEHVGGG
jgi:hypothetical protein